MNRTYEHVTPNGKRKTLTMIAVPKLIVSWARAKNKNVTAAHMRNLDILARGGQPRHGLGPITETHEEQIKNGQGTLFGHAREGGWDI